MAKKALIYAFSPVPGSRARMLTGRGYTADITPSFEFVLESARNCSHVLYYIIKGPNPGEDYEERISELKNTLADKIKSGKVELTIE
ncbi:MAG: hypothetical protein ABIH72_00085 [archaeon]